MSSLKRCPNPKCQSTNIQYSAYSDAYLCRKCNESFINLHDPAKRAQIPAQPNYALYMCPNCYGHTANYDLARDEIVCMNCNYRGSPNGQHRQSPQGTYSNPSQGSGAGTGGASTQQAAIQAAQQIAAAQQGGLAGQLGQLAQHIPTPGQASWLRAVAQQLVQQHAKPVKLPYAGITVGEILAWRCWRLTPHGFLQSGYKDTIWLPGVSQDAKEKDMDNGWGIHAFKKEASQQLHAAVDEYGAGIEGRSARLSVAIGTVALWGRVIEHDLGYRAEHARVHTIEALAGVPLAESLTRLTLLRQAYCPAQPDTQAPNGATQVKPKQE